ncbi:SNF5-domain-containing protein [Punctularia strigosozonata HHB-11173 SS5]|uniref:SNF5-domain-containing protein n=1 Tax=Punctularia strigosozonata (strain HHB-11173) TaxID=741275 RepID=UPI0004416D6E|nr:SNF5-domain-containing protein [Punctularia strigosozonata HHB-11173 SS5]EIN14518.1 SNF5-domain-containing protein [Punctularia strigosozonata HHB-11173 SS5]
MNPNAFQQAPQTSINPAALLAPQQGPYPPQNANKVAYGAAGFNPHMFQQPGAAVNPAQLMNGQQQQQQQQQQHGGGGGGMDPAMFMQMQQQQQQRQQLQHAQQQQQQQQLAMANGAMNGVNPNHPTANAQQAYMMMNNNPQFMQQLQQAKMQQRMQQIQQQHQQQQHFNPQAFQQQQQHQQYQASLQQQPQPPPQTQQPFYDPHAIGRPPSSASASGGRTVSSGMPMNPQQMVASTPKMGNMAPPSGLPRPPTARPPTSMGMSPPNPQAQAQLAVGIQRPPTTRPGTSMSSHSPQGMIAPGMGMGMGMNGMQQQQQQQQPHMTPGRPTGTPTPMHHQQQHPQGMMVAPLTPQNTGGAQGSVQMAPNPAAMGMMAQGMMNPAAMGAMNGGMGMNMNMNMGMGVGMGHPGMAAASPGMMRGQPQRQPSSGMNGHTHPGMVPQTPKMGMGVGMDVPGLGEPSPHSHPHQQPQMNMGMSAQGMGMGVGMARTPSMTSLQGATPQPQAPSQGHMSPPNSASAGGMFPPGVSGVGMGMNGMGMGMTMGSGGGLTPQQQAQLANAVGARPRASSVVGPGPMGMPVPGMQQSAPQPQPPQPPSAHPTPTTPVRPPMPAAPSSASSVPAVNGAISASAPPPQAIPSVVGAGMGLVLPPPPATEAPLQPGVVPQLPPLPAHTKLDPVVTRVSVVPLADSERLIPPLGEDEIENVKKWMALDSAYTEMYSEMNDRMAEERRAMGLSGRAWWEKDLTSPTAAADEARRRQQQQPKFQITFPKDREREAKSRRGGKYGRREGLKLPRKLAPGEADRVEVLVPIRLDLEVEGQHRLRDTFVWNLNGQSGELMTGMVDPVVTPEAFAQSIVDDYQLPSSYQSTITKAIQEQLSDYQAHTSGGSNDHQDDEEKDEKVTGPARAGVLGGDDRDSKWWEAWRKRVRTKAGFVKNMDRKEKEGRKAKRRKIAQREEGETDGAEADVEADVEDSPVDVHAIPVDHRNMQEEMRITIKLDIIVGSMELNDQFEWDLDNEDASPEQFAEVYARDLGLGGEFKTAIAHTIREQVLSYQKSLFLVGNPTPAQLQDEDLKSALLPSLVSGARPADQVQSFTPLLNYVSDGEIERSEREREKELNKRKKRRGGTRRLAALPDREPLRTYRTPAIGFPEVDPANLAKDTAVAVPTSTRRAAAAAAQLTIANMVASENRDDGRIVPQIMPLVATPAAVAQPSSKEAKVKGLFKPPPYPPTVLRPRARVPAPTPSTVAEPTALMSPIESDPPVTLAQAVVVEYKVPKTPAPMTAKRARELEREAKEKEYADGQHANLIDGVWHCSNCGIPESIATGRRKGPLGDKSQCGDCGRFWHRHRRPRPVEYNSSLEYHQRQQGSGKTAARRGRRLNAEAATTPVPEPPTEPQTPQTEWADGPPGSALRHEVDGDRASSPASSASSTSETPLAQFVKANGTSQAASPPQSEDKRPRSSARPPSGANKACYSSFLP